MIIHKVRNNTKLLEVVIIVILLMIYQGGSLYAATNLDIGAEDIVIEQSGDYVITGTTTTNQIVVNTGITANITLNSVSIQNTALDRFCPIELKSGANATITLIGNNILKSGALIPGILVPDTSIFTLMGTGNLTVNSISAPAIGGIYGAAIGTINISGGNLVAYASAGAVIGTDTAGMGGTINFTGGNVIAYGSTNGANIGSGANDSVGVNINITGGTISTYGANASGELNGSSGNAKRAPVNITGGSVKGHFPFATAPDGSIRIRVKVDLAQSVTGIKSVFVDNIDYNITSLNQEEKRLYIYLPEGSHNIVVTDSNGGITNKTVNTQTNTDLNQGDVLIYKPGTYTITGSNNAATIAVAENTNNVDITINNVNIDNSNDFAFLAMYGSRVNLKLLGTNNFMALNNAAGTQVNQAAILTISGTGTLNSRGRYLAPGIGAGSNRIGGQIIINGGTINAEGNSYGAGLGSGHISHTEAIIINGGNVTAIAGFGAAGIGNGSGGSVGPITINGGNVNTTGGESQTYGQGGAGIGGNTSSPIIITGGTVKAQGGNGMLILDVQGTSGAGIGSTGMSGCSVIKITGGTITATGGAGAANIGAGQSGSSGPVYIDGGSIKGYQPISTNSKSNQVFRVIKDIKANGRVIKSVSVDGIDNKITELHDTSDPSLYLYLTPEIHKVIVTYADGIQEEVDAEVLINENLNLGDVLIYKPGTYNVIGQNNANRIVVSSNIKGVNISITDISIISNANFFGTFDIG